MTGNCCTGYLTFLPTLHKITQFYHIVKSQFYIFLTPEPYRTFTIIYRFTILRVMKSPTKHLIMMGYLLPLMNLSIKGVVFWTEMPPLAVTIPKMLNTSQMMWRNSDKWYKLLWAALNLTIPGLHLNILVFLTSSTSQPSKLCFVPSKYAKLRPIPV